MEAKPEFTSLQTRKSSSPSRPTSATRSSRLSALANGSPVKGSGSGSGGAWADDDLDI